MRPIVATSSVHYLKLIETWLGVGTWTLDLRSGRLNGSVGLRRLLGVAPDVLLTIDLLLDMVHPDDRWMADEMFRATARSGEEHRYRVGPGDGAVRWHGCWSETDDGEGGGALRRGVVRDVTRSQAALDRLGRHHRVFEALVEVSGGAALRLDADGAPHDAPSWTRLTGQSQEDLRRRGWMAALHPDDRPRAAADWARATVEEPPLDGPVRVRGTAGDRRMTLKARPVASAEGRLLEWLLFLAAAEPEAPLRPDPKAPSPAQLRGCRGLLDWTVSRLAANSGVSAATIVRYEAGGAGVRAGTVARLRAAVESAGVRFSAGPDGPAIHHRPASGGDA